MTVATTATAAWGVKLPGNADSRPNGPFIIHEQSVAPVERSLERSLAAGLAAAARE